MLWKANVELVEKKYGLYAMKLVFDVVREWASACGDVVRGEIWRVNRD